MIERRKYSKEFKLDAISLVTEQGYAIAEAARSLDINANVLGFLAVGYRFLKNVLVPAGFFLRWSMP